MASSDTNTSGSAFLFDFPSLCTPEQVSTILEAWSTKQGPEDRVKGVRASYTAQCLFSQPGEDSVFCRKIPSPTRTGEDWMAWGIFDGHGGAVVSKILCTSLLRHMEQVLGRFSEYLGDDEVVHDAIQTAFVEFDDNLVSHAQSTMDDKSLSRTEKLMRLITSANGSCALLSLYDPSSRKLHVACTGDSRAILGSYDSLLDTIDVMALSNDQTGLDPAEEARIQALHPGEDIKRLIRNGRVLGLVQPSRAFGDGPHKWPVDVRRRVTKSFPTVREVGGTWATTPPYITAKPEVTTTVLLENKNKKEFMIMASDGLWRHLTNEKAVLLLREWWQWARRDVCEKKLEVGLVCTIQDSNPAVHLIRNALDGAGHRDLSGRLSFPPPYATRFTDDTTVVVVFFKPPKGEV